uniref:RdRp n=1 Tax=Hubei reo-like virus 3 TaxID=1923178 RepID=A0A1L3KP55_9VIRU|nr:RdRp [Hubei reo-like virus 3]
MSVLNIEKLKILCRDHDTYIQTKIKNIENEIIRKTKSKNSVNQNLNYKSLPPWEQWRSKKDYQLPKVISQLKINYDELIKTAVQINEKFGIITSILRNNVSMTSNYNNIIRLFQFDDELSPIIEICNMNRDAILLIIKSVNTTKPIPCHDDPCQESEAIDFSFSKNCKRYEFGMVTWKQGQRIPDTEFRYIVNCEVKSSLQMFLSELSLNDNSTKELTNRKRESMLYQKLLTKTLNQTRSINIAKMCFANFLLFKSVPTNGNTLHHCFNEENPSIYYLQKLLNDYITWPFLDTTTEMYYPNELKMSSQLPILIYSVLNKALSYTFGIMTVGYFNLSMKVFLEWAKVSFDDLHLLQKSDMNKVTKFLNERVSASKIFTYSGNNVTGVRNVHLEKEFWYKNEKEELEEILTQVKTTKPYFDYIIKLRKRTFSRDELILHKMALENCTNNTTFKKSSPALEYERSAKPRLNKPVTNPYPEEMIDGFTTKPRYKGVMGRIWNNLSNKMEYISEKLKNRDFQAEFYERLTNNASGLTSADILHSKRNHALLKTFVSAPYGQRYITALIDNEVLFNRLLAISSITGRVMAGKRDQIDRRVRWIMMVLNCLQAVFSLALSIGREQHKTVSTVASGKQVGNIKDMMQVLRTSSDPNAIITDNDIVGMDSSTQEQVVGAVLCFVFGVLSGVGDAPYFFSNGREATADVYDEIGNVIGKNTYNLNGAQDYMIEMIGKMRSNNFILSDTWVGSDVTIPGSVFWSGAYHTAVQHNVWLSEMLSLLLDDMIRTYTETNARLDASVMGDDVSAAILQNQNSELADKNATEIIAQLIAMLDESGFHAEPECSRCSSTFLQQTGLYGAVKPKSARLSLNVSEHEISRIRDPISQIKEMGDILDEMSGRSPFPEAAINILNSYWCVNRVLALSKGIEGNKSFEKRLINLKNKSVGAYKNWIRVSTSGVKIIVPYVGIYLKEIFGNTLPSFHSVIDNVTKKPSFLSPKGTFTERCLFEMSYIKRTSSEINNITERDRQNKLNRLNMEFKLGLISEEIYNKKKDLPGRFDTINKINFKIIDDLGFTFAQWLSENIISKARMLKRDLENPSFNTIVNIGKQKQNQRKAALSYAGVNNLRKGGYSIPESLIYYNQPKVRVEQAFALKLEKSRKFGDDNESIIDKLIDYINGEVKNFKFGELQLLDYNVIPTNQKIELSPDAHLLIQSSLGPCASIKTIHHRGLMLFGFPFNLKSRDLAVESFKNVLSFGADADKVLNEAVRIYNRDQRYLVEFLYAIGVEPSEHKRMESIIKEFRFQGITQYKSVFNVRKFFYFIPSTSRANSLSIFRQPITRHRRWGVLHSMIVRDYFLAFPETKEKIFIDISDNMSDRIMML